MREHNWASIVNTSIHEAYPGHHHQLSAALASPTPARLLTDAPEFLEGWGMYCEQLMLEDGFEDTPARRVIVATDAIWRACRIILDIRLHRGEIGVGEAIDFLVEHTRFERPIARAEVHRYTQTPTYNLSLPARQGAAAAAARGRAGARSGADFSLKRFHDALLYSGSLPVSFHRRLLAGEGGGPTPAGRTRRRALMLVIPSLDIQHGRSRLVWWPGASSGPGTPTDRPAAIADALVAAGRAGSSTSSTSMARSRADRPTWRPSRPWPGRWRRPLQVAGGIDGPEQIELAFAAGATRVVMPLWAVAEDRAAPRRVPAHRRETGWRWASTRGPRACATIPGATARTADDSTSSSSSWQRPACAASSCPTCARRMAPALVARLPAAPTAEHRRGRRRRRPR